MAIKTRFQKTIIWIFLTILISFWFPAHGVLAQDKQLEVTYPTIQGFQPQTVATSFPQYVKYIFNITIAIVGLIAFGVLVFAGIRYVTSAGNPEEIKKSRHRIRAAFLGLLILFFSYLILTTINPQLVIFQLPGLTAVPVTPTTPSTPNIGPTIDVYEKIRILVNALSAAVAAIDNQVNSLKSLIDQCDCKYPKSMCICGQGSEGSYSLDYYGSCNGLYCYNATSTPLCPTEAQLKSGQQKLLSLRDEILYYKNRILAEKADLLLEIDHLKEVIDYYTKKIQAENQVLQQLQDENARKLEQEIISAYEKLKTEAEKEKYLREELIKHFDNLAKPNGLIDQLAAEVQKVSDQIDKCLLDGVKSCQPSCSGGCHNTLGCFPGSCSGGKPSVCNIDNQSTIQDLKSKIDSEIRAILDLVERAVEPTPGAPGSCETSGGVCVGATDSCPTNYSESNQYICQQTDRKCCMSTTAAACQCSNVPLKCSTSPLFGCVSLPNYGIAYKDGCYTDSQMAEKLKKFDSCLWNTYRISGWRVTEACPPTATAQHKSQCHHVNGKCVDANSLILCNNQAAVENCIRKAGFSSFLNECSNLNGPHFHINF